MKTIFFYLFTLLLFSLGFDTFAQREKPAKQEKKEPLLKPPPQMDPELFLLHKVIIHNAANMDCIFYINNVKYSLKNGYEMTFSDVQTDL